MASSYSPYGQARVRGMSSRQDRTELLNVLYDKPKFPSRIVPQSDTPIVPSGTPVHPTRPTPASPSTGSNCLGGRRPTNPPNPSRGFFSLLFRRCPRTKPAEPRVRPRPVIAYPWTQPDTFVRLDIMSRTTAHTAISDILFNYQLDTSTAAELIADACQTAHQVGVSTHDLLSCTVFCGFSDLGITPLCLEASRVDMEEGGTDLVQWLIKNTRPSEVQKEIKKGCLMRLDGMGEQNVWNVLRSFVPTVYGEALLAYEVNVQGLTDETQGRRGCFEGASKSMGEVKWSICTDDPIGAAPSYLEIAGTETLKYSRDGSNISEEKAPEAILPRFHWAQVIIPSFKESDLRLNSGGIYARPNKFFGSSISTPMIPLTNKALTFEWMFEGRVWALSMGEDSLLLILRQTSPFVTADPVKVKAAIRIIPLGSQQSGTKKVGSWIRTMVPTPMSSNIPLPSSLYECEFEERELVPGSVRVGGNSSLWKTETQTSTSSLSKLIGPHRGIKIEVVVKLANDKWWETGAKFTTSTGPGGQIQYECGSRNE